MIENQFPSKVTACESAQLELQFWLLCTSLLIFLTDALKAETEIITHNVQWSYLQLAPAKSKTTIETDCRKLI